MKRLAFGLAVLVAGTALGVGSAMMMIRGGTMIGRIDNGQWISSRTIGSVDADPYTRALIARIGLLGLNQNETIYYNRTTDEEGRALDAGCLYRAEGGTMPARWWSITLYAPDSFLAVNGDDHPSIDATSIAAAADGRWRARIAPTQGGAANWISSKNAGAFSLSIRLYNPEVAVRDHMADVPLPRIIRESCAGDTK